VTNPNDHPEDKELLRKVMKIISDNEELTPQVEIFVDKIKGMVELLKQHQVPLEEHQIDIVLIDQTKQEFNESKQLVLTLKEEIYPLQQTEGQYIKQKQKDFVAKLQGFEEAFMEVMPFKFEDNATVDHIKAAY
jgi:hypothetical protein